MRWEPNKTAFGHECKPQFQDVDEFGIGVEKPLPPLGVGTEARKGLKFSLAPRKGRRSESARSRSFVSSRSGRTRSRSTSFQAVLDA